MTRHMMLAGFYGRKYELRGFFSLIIGPTVHVFRELSQSRHGAYDGTTKREMIRLRDHKERDDQTQRHILLVLNDSVFNGQPLAFPPRLLQF